MKFLVIWNRIGDYHRARLRVLSEKIGLDNLIAADFGANDSLYQWESSGDTKYKHLTLSSKSVDQTDLIRRLVEFWKVIQKDKIDVVCIPGYGKIEYIFFIALSRLFKRKVVLFAESWYGNNLILNTTKRLFLNVFVSAFFVSGKRAEEHFHLTFKIPLKKIIKGYSVVDNDHFYSKFQISKSLTLQPVLLCVARYSPEKNLLNLVLAYQRSQMYKKWKLVLIGDGVQKSALKELIGEDKEWIALEGWKSYDELPKWYNNANAFILPSTFEPWGLVVNEAMAAGLPVFVSQNCGCVPELVSKYNGFTFDNVDGYEDLVRVLNKIDRYSSEELQRMGNKSKEIIQNISLGNWANNLSELLEA